MMVRIQLIRATITINIVIIFIGCTTTSLQLLPDPVDEWEHTNVTLRCWNETNRALVWIWNDATSNVILDTNGCSATGYLTNSSIFQYSCTQWSVIIKNITQRYHKDIWSCRTFGGMSKNVSFLVKVQVHSVTLSNKSPILDAVENKSITLQCASSPCRPAPTFTWYAVPEKDGNTLILNRSSPLNINGVIGMYSDTVKVTVNRSMNRWKLLCAASNRENVPAVNSSSIELNITYPPSGPVQILGFKSGQLYDVIRGGIVNLTCEITGGNPLPQLQWNHQYSSEAIRIDNAVRKLLSWQPSGTGQTKLECHSIHSMSYSAAHVVANVLYPPNRPYFKLQNIKVLTLVRVFENDTLTLTCAADSNPPPTSFNWSRFTEKNESTIVISNIQKGDKGPLACQVYNNMVPTTGSPLSGTNESEVYVDVLYPPQVKQLENRVVIEGGNVNCECEIKSGNPNRTTFKWIRTTDDNVIQTGRVLQLTNVSRSATGKYRCVAENEMNSTNGTVRRGISNGEFFFDVQYAVYVSQLMVDAHFENNVTLNENDTIKLVCTVEGNPPPAGNIILSTPVYGSEVERQELNVSHLPGKTFEAEFVASCYDAGEYTCTGSNKPYTGGQRTSNKTVTIYINCAPRMSRFHIAEHEVNSSVHVPVTLTFTAVAYPVPQPSGYIWSRRFNDHNWTYINGTNPLYNVSIQGLQTNLTVTNVSKSDYGLYNLTISNSFGSFTFTFSLNPAGKPSPPVKYGILEELVMENSLTIWWEPEFDGGDTQYFIISYRESSSDAWLNFTSIPHESDKSMTKTISSLLSGTEYHVLIYAENKFGSVRTEREIVGKTKEVRETSSVTGTAVGGGVGGGILAVAIIVAAVVFLRNWAQRKRSQNSHKYMDNSFEKKSEDWSKGTQNGKNFDDRIHLVTKNQSADSPKLPVRQPTKRETTLDILEPIDFDDKKPDDGVYGNAYEMIRRIECLEIAELVAYLSDKTAEFFRLEYQKLPQRLIHPYNDSQLPENLPLNRYKGIYPYDHSRVKDLNDPTFFVNASYIDGHKKKKEYIASLGPLERTSKHFVTFWQMVWSEKSDVVVMLTKLIEPTGEKCEKYWPEFGTSLTYGEITVAGTGEDEFADYILRKFSLTKGKETRKFLQFHFMAWPDKSIPESTACLLEFRRTVRSKHKTGPLIVHCSAGIGRTGTFIAIDILIEEGKHKGAVNVLQCVKKMRDQRTMMVQTVEQYHYIFKAVVNALVFDNDAIAVKAYPKAMSKIKRNRIQEMYECLNKSVETDSTAESTARTVNKTQRDKNRVDSDIPGDEYRVRLFLDRDADMSDYINAVYINSFIKGNYFIGAQSPLPNKVEDFLAMIVQVECSCIVSLEETPQGQAMGMYHPSDSTILKIGKFRISSKVLDSRETYTVSKMSITYKGQREERQKHVYHFQYTDWPHGQKVPSNQENFVKFTKDVETFAKQCCTQESHVLVHCLNAFERSCLFCAVVTLTQKVDVEGEVCVPNILRLIRSRRRKAFPNKEQFEFCFNVVNTYIGMEKSTDTADDKTYMNTALA